MQREILFPTLLSLVLALMCPAILSAQGFTIYYNDDRSIRNCNIIDVSELYVSIEYTPFLPGVYVKKDLPLNSVNGIRELSRSNVYSPYLTLLGSYIGVKYFMKKTIPRSEKTVSERFATVFDEPVNFMTSVCVGGAVGYMTGYILLGGNSELIRMDKLSSSEKRATLLEYIRPSKRLGDSGG